MIDGIDWGIVIWLVLAALSGVGEMLTGTYFLIPLLVAAIAAAIAVALGAEMIWVLLVFGAIALLGFSWVLRFAAATKGEPPATHEGALRYIDAHGSVTSDIQSPNAGRVQIGGESWRALSHTGDPIDAGVRVRVIEVRGNALVVEPI
jgi:membrane protein implicated in regulation of membrane protease activity